MALSSDIGALLKIVPQYVQGRKQQKEGRIKEAQGQVYMDFANQQRDKAIEQNQEYFYLLGVGFSYTRFLGIITCYQGRYQ